MEVKVDLSRRHRDEIQTLSKKHREELEVYTHLALCSASLVPSIFDFMK